MPLINITPEARDKIKLAVFQASGITVTGTSDALEKELIEVTDKISRRYTKPAEATDIFAPARTLYRSIGLDPTKSRPSSEALIRRVIKKTGLYRINRVVDTCNLCSIDFALSIGLYDTEQVQWPVALRSGKTAEGYKGLGKDHVNVDGRWTLADQVGPFGNPSADSFRTRIQDSTRECTFVIYAPVSYPESELCTHLNLAALRMIQFAGGEIVYTELIQL